MTEVKPRHGLRRSGPVPARTGTRTAVNRAIVRKLKQNDCDPVALLARVAEDEELPMALRFRAANNLTKLAYAPQPRVVVVPAPEPEEPEYDVAAIIAASWAEHDAEKGEEAEAEKRAKEKAELERCAAKEAESSREAEPSPGEYESSVGTENPAPPADGPVTDPDHPLRTGWGPDFPDDDWQSRMRNWPRRTISD